MERLDVYSAVHKMQRARLFELTVAIGKADPADRGMAEHLGRAVAAMAEELRAHAAHESRFIHPLLRAHAPHVAATLDAEHHDLDVRLDRLCALAADPWCASPHRLYRALASFTAVYLGHLAEEEEVALPELWGTCSDEELAGILSSFRASRSELENLTAVIAQLPTLNPAERARMIKVALQNGTGEVSELTATILGPEQLGSLRQEASLALSTASPGA